MSRINTTYKVRKAWFELLNNNVSVPVFGADVPAGYSGNYIQLRIESNTDTPNNHKFYDNVVIITEAVAQFDTMIDDSIAPGIDGEIDELLFPTDPGKHALPAQDDIQIVSVQRRDATYLQEDDGAIPRIHRVITRNVHRVGQLVDQS